MRHLWQPLTDPVASPRDYPRGCTGCGIRAELREREPNIEALRRLLPEAKRLLSRQHIGAPWHALLAAEDLLREIDEEPTP